MNDEFSTEDDFSLGDIYPSPRRIPRPPQPPVSRNHIHGFDAPYDEEDDEFDSGERGFSLYHGEMIPPRSSDDIHECAAGYNYPRYEKIQSEKYVIRDPLEDDLFDHRDPRMDQYAEEAYKYLEDPYQEPEVETFRGFFDEGFDDGFQDGDDNQPRYKGVAHPEDKVADAPEPESAVLLTSKQEEEDKNRYTNWYDEILPVLGPAGIFVGFVAAIVSGCYAFYTIRAADAEDMYRAVQLPTAFICLSFIVIGIGSCFVGKNARADMLLGYIQTILPFAGFLASGVVSWKIDGARSLFIVLVFSAVTCILSMVMCFFFIIQDSLVTMSRSSLSLNSRWVGDPDPDYISEKSISPGT